jgi:hypothetical protein
MSIFADALKLSLPPDPTSMIEGSVTSTITSGIVFGSDPAKTLKTTVNNVLGVDPATANTLSPNFDRFSVLEFPQSFGVVGNLFQSGQDLIPIARISSNFGGTFIGDELTQINVENLLRNPGVELSTFANNLSRGLVNQAAQQGNSIARSVVQDIKDVFRGAVNSLLDPAAAKTTNLGVVDSRLSYAFYGPLDANKQYSKGAPAQTPNVKPPASGVGPSGPSIPPPPPVGFQGVEPITNPHYVFRLNTVANGMSSGDDGAAQSRLLLDKESRMGVSKIGRREVTLSAILSKFGGFSQSNPTPYRAADFLWLKYYNRIPLTRLVTLRRYMFPIQDNLTRSPYFGGGTSKAGAYKIKGWSNNPISQMVTYFGGESGNDLSTIIKVSVSSKWEETAGSKVNDIELFGGSPLDATTMFDSSRVAKITAGIAKLGLNLGAGAAAGVIGGSTIQAGKDFFNKIESVASSSNITASELAAGILAYTGVIDPARFAGISSYLDTFNPYAQGGYLSDLYREPYNRIITTMQRKPGLSGGVIGDGSINVKFEYSLKAIGHINAKAAMLDIMANILATTHYRGSFWGGESRFYLNKGIFPLLDEKQTIEFVKLIWTGNFDGATQQFESVIKEAFGNELPTVDAIKGLLALRDSNIQTPKNSGQAQNNKIVGGKDTGATAIAAATASAGIPDKLKDIAAIDLLAGLFGLTGGGGNASIPAFQALRTGAPVGEWHLTVGNPFKPIAVIGNLICEGVDISFNNELGPDDFPTEMTATVRLKPGMSRANQDVESVFNDGFGPLYIPKPDLFEGKELEQVQEEISKQVGRSGIFDFMGFLPESTVESLSNFHKITSNSETILPTPHISRARDGQTDNPRGS